MSDTSNRDANRFIIRMPEGLRDRIKAVAEQNNRSMNAEIVGTLQSYYPERMTLPDLRDYLRDLTSSYVDSPSGEILEEIISMVELVSEKLPQQDNSVWRAMNQDPETEDLEREQQARIARKNRD
ncbi:Arc family DNA-binding protein [Agrobacterium sp. S2/73]|uniref:Arc family DNA-binding protein n=1 Tax=unclassified Agrobacterium TaxID=2632611 RepID=UPI001ADD4194|nr:Arc family DNA-binding protein [Agrobacterium sp. S7/73]MBO9108729.1 Arc family DNA-binding protein [Agrobacterium sp. S2/73]QXZ73512.1 Arc family DNA-binding protein [Agrobacterium sp. S7/73]